jgi:hypothetical protein
MIRLYFTPPPDMPSILFEFRSEASTDEVIEGFFNFLKACGYTEEDIARTIKALEKKDSDEAYEV